MLPAPFCFMSSFRVVVVSKSRFIGILSGLSIAFLLLRCCPTESLSFLAATPKQPREKQQQQQQKKVVTGSTSRSGTCRKSAAESNIHDDVETKIDAATATTMTSMIVHEPPNQSSVGIVLNANARGVTPDLAPVAMSVLGNEYVHFTNSKDEAREAARILLKQNVSVIVPVGGDGTLTSLISFLIQERQRNESLQSTFPDYLATNTNKVNKTTTTTAGIVNGVAVNGGSSSVTKSTSQNGKRKITRRKEISMDEAAQSLPLIAYIPLGTGNGVGSVAACRYPTKRRSNLFSKLGSTLKLGFGRRRNSNNNKHQEMRRILELLVEVGNQIQQTECNRTTFNDENSDALDLVDIVELPVMKLSTIRKPGKDHTDSGHPVNGGTTTTSDDLCFFAGVGFDSLMLEDFKTIRTWSQRTKIFSSLSGVPGYCVALVTRTLPKCIARNAHLVRVQISTKDPDAAWVDHRRGDVVQRISHQQGHRNPFAQRLIERQRNGGRFGNKQQQEEKENSNNDSSKVLFEGTAGIVAAATTPFYGGGLRLFPFARMTLDKMHLRVGRIHPLLGFLNIPRIFAGSYRDTRESTHGCIDFLGDDFEVRILPSAASERNETSSSTNKDYHPMQHSGESIGDVKQFRLSVVKEPIRFVTFLEKRRIRDE